MSLASEVQKWPWLAQFPDETEYGFESPPGEAALQTRLRLDPSTAQPDELHEARSKHRK